MSTTRDAFLDRVRQALREGNKAGSTPPLPERGNLGYQGAGDDPVARFGQELQVAGGHPYVVNDKLAVIAKDRQLVISISAKRIIISTSD